MNTCDVGKRQRGQGWGAIRKKAGCPKLSPGEGYYACTVSIVNWAPQLTIELLVLLRPDILAKGLVITRSTAISPPKHVHFHLVNFSSVHVKQMR